MSKPSFLIAKHQIHALTSLRFFAAFCIVLLHATNHDFLDISWSKLLDLSKSVSFFFVLSGFVLTYAYINRNYYISDFYQARFARIWPATVASVFFVLLLLPRSYFLPEVNSDWSLGSVFFLNLIGIQSWVPIPAVFFGLNAVTWSISVEASFYGFFPWFSKMQFRLLLRSLIIVCICGLSAAYYVESSSIQSFSPQTFDLPVWQGLLYINPIARLPEFILGILGGRVFASQFYQQKTSEMHSISDKYPFIYSAIELSIFLCLVCLGFNVNLYLVFLGLMGCLIGGSCHVSIPPTILNYYQIILNQWFSGLSFACLICVAASSRGILGQFLNWRALVFLGEISFGLYLYHQPLMIRAAQANGFMLGGFQLLPDSFFPVLAWSIVVSMGSFYCLEKPLQRVLRPRKN